MEVDLSEDEHAVNQVCLPDTEVLNVADFRFREGPLTPNDYTYFTSNKSTMFNQVWAGPSHWKLKNIKPASKTFIFLYFLNMFLANVWCFQYLFIWERRSRRPPSESRVRQYLQIFRKRLTSWRMKGKTPRELKYLTIHSGKLFEM